MESLEILRVLIGNYVEQQDYVKSFDLDAAHKAIQQNFNEQQMTCMVVVDVETQLGRSKSWVLVSQ